MTEDQSITPEPGSVEARAKGCICESKKNDCLMVHEHCPLHWHMLQSHRTHAIQQQLENVTKYITEAKSQNNALLAALAVCSMVMTWVLFSN